MKIERMETVPSSRTELERHLFLLAEAIKGDKFRLSSGMTHAIDGLRRLRKLPNGRVDFLSLDESTRLTANMLANMGQMTSPGDAQRSNEQSDVAD